MEISLNEFQSTLDSLQFDSQPDEIKEQFIDFISNVPLISRLISPNRKRAKDLPRDEEGKIIVDITNPHILEDMDYFRPAALHFLQYGCYTKLRPNKNPNSEYGKWMREEVRRCREGYIRESDGEWIPGDYYFFLNYCPMLLSEKDKSNSKKANRVMSFPHVWDGHYLKFHYLWQARQNGKHALELASRQKGKTFCAASLLTKRFGLGESEKVREKVTCYATASEKGYLVKGDQTLDKFQYNIDFLAQNTEWPYRDKLINTIQNMQWVAGYKDLDTETRRGTLNAVMGTTAKDDESKLRGTRGVLYIIEEAGSFPRLLQLWNNLLPSVQDGEDNVYGLLFAYGTSGDSQSDFSAMAEMMYKPTGYHVYRVDNVYDLNGKGGRDFAFFFPAYMNYSNCYDHNGNSDVTKALLAILKNRFTIKYNSTDISTITRTIAEYPITPQEAVLRTIGSIFPTAQLTERLNEIDGNPNIFDDVYIGDLLLKSNGEVEFKITNDQPIRDYPLKDNTAKGCFEIYQMPERDATGKVKPYRYIAGLDPYNNDQAESKSLGSFFVLDLLQDKLVCEYTGRTPYLDDFFEKVRLACIFYNCKCLYESNNKGCFSYFSKRNSLHLLADTPEYLRDKQIIKYSSFGSSSKGVNAIKAVNIFADNLTKDWLLKPITIISQEGEEVVERSVPNLYFIKNRALLKELISYNPYDNFDRVRALGMLMLYREEKQILYQGDVSQADQNEPTYEPDDFFNVNFEEKFGNNYPSML